MTLPEWLAREFEAVQREWDATPESCRPVVVRDRAAGRAEQQQAKTAVLYRADKEPSGPVCYAWSVTRRWNGPVCRHVSCWDIMEGRARTALAQLTGPRP